jgi:hypothetical protein
MAQHYGKVREHMIDDSQLLVQPSNLGAFTDELALGFDHVELLSLPHFVAAAAIKSPRRDVHMASRTLQCYDDTARPTASVEFMAFWRSKTRVHRREEI